MKYLLPILFIALSITAAAQDIQDDYCISDDEFRLYELINAHRLINGEKEIPLSASLCYVARTHVIDLFTNHPDTSICNLNSWSDKGNWTPCCHNKYIPQEDCIRNKPKELTDYTGEGYELTYAEVLNANPDTVFRFWKKTGVANEFMLNEGLWEEKTWRAMGIGMYKSYAVVWMGQKTDYHPAPEKCSSADKVSENNSKPFDANETEVVSSQTGRFYIVVASFQSLNDAKKEAKRLKNTDGAKVVILKNTQGQYRISINDYPNLEAAKEGKAEYQSKFNGAWILNF